MKKPVIICVDDEITVLDSLRRELSEALEDHFEIETAVGGIEALELVEDLIDEGCDIAIVIADYIMPDLKGDEVLKQIHQRSPKTIKIMLTGQATIEGVTNAINSAKLYRYIAKPWQAEELNITVKEGLKVYFLEQKIIEQNAKLRESERRLAQFLEAMPVGVSVQDTTGQITYANQKAKELLGIQKIPDTKTKRLADVYQVYRGGTDQLYPTEELPIVRSLSGETVRADDLEIHQEDRIVPLEVTSTPIRDDSGKIIYAIAAFQDISERKKSEAEREKFTQELFKLNEAFSRFVPRQFLQLLDKQTIVDIQQGDSVAKEMTVLFSDIRDFTKLSETMTPEDNFKFINGYLSRMEPAILQNHGFIDKYIGDAIMALFPGSADDAIKAAIAMLKALAEYNTTRQGPERPPIQIGIGINTGKLMLGIVGGNFRMDSTAISDAVNLSSRLEQLTKVYSVPLLISHYTLSQLQEPMNFALRLIDRVQVKGKSQKVAVFEVFDADTIEIKQAKLSTKPLFEKALLLYNSGWLNEAKQLFEKCLQENPRDRVTQIYLMHCQNKISD
ncbi:adenylate/guanylate cyclase domain-containing protein [Microseira sp. BLCC-F43]|jgi:class 3 adenylate cyclase/PAS domain-containing protein|uniref:adenylate/guanylate cyclase domain-containing protein n=1 Tax=Microseira sp. BLCC-F43 TaxID=3153602 RepID=UPI0035B6DB59